jgi:hypothetical protein
MAFPWRNGELKYADRRCRAACGYCRKCSIGQTAQASAYHLTLRMLSAQSRRPTVVLDAAVRRFIADIRASYSIMSAVTSVCGLCCRYDKG